MTICTRTSVRPAGTKPKTSNTTPTVPTKNGHTQDDNRRNALTSSLTTNHYISRALPKRNEEARLVGRGTMIP
jgi:hypothetical protein